MLLNKKAICLLMSKKCWNVGELLKNSGVTSYTFYRGLHSGVTPKYAGKLARALDVDVEEIIIMED